LSSWARAGFLRFDGRAYRVQLVDTAPPSGTRPVALTDIGPAHFRFSRFVTGDRFVATIGTTTYDLALERYRWVRGGWSPSRTAAPPTGGMVNMVAYVVPAAPLAHEPVDLMFWSNDCNVFRRIEPRTGGFRFVHEQVAPNPFLCDTVSGDYRVALGSLPPGNYSVELGSYDPAQSDNWRSFRRIEFAVSPGPPSNGSTAGHQGPDWSGVWTAPAEPYTAFQVVHSRQPGTVDAGGRSIDQIRSRSGALRVRAQRRHESLRRHDRRPDIRLRDRTLPVVARQLVSDGALMDRSLSPGELPLRSASPGYFTRDRARARRTLADWRRSGASAHSGSHGPSEDQARRPKGPARATRAGVRRRRRQCRLSAPPHPAPDAIAVKRPPEHFVMASNPAIIVVRHGVAGRFAATS
jgi:hypothetical protein